MATHFRKISAFLSDRVTSTNIDYQTVGDSSAGVTDTTFDSVYVECSVCEQNLITIKLTVVYLNWQYVCRIVCHLKGNDATEGDRSQLPPPPPPLPRQTTITPTTTTTTPTYQATPPSLGSSLVSCSSTIVMFALKEPGEGGNETPRRPPVVVHHATTSHLCISVEHSPTDLPGTKNKG